MPTVPARPSSVHRRRRAPAPSLPLARAAKHLTAARFLLAAAKETPAAERQPELRAAAEAAFEALRVLEDMVPVPALIEQRADLLREVNAFRAEVLAFERATARGNVIELKPIFRARCHLSEARDNVGLAMADASDCRRAVARDTANVHLRAGEKLLVEAVRAAAPGLVRVLERELDLFDELRGRLAGAEAALVFEPTRCAAIIDLATARRDRQMLADLRELHQRLDEQGVPGGAA